MKILVVRVGRTGDMVMITAALRALLQSYPTAELHLLTSPDGQRTLAAYDERVTKVFLYQRKSLLQGPQRRRLRRALARETYAHIYNFELNPSFARLIAGLGGRLHSLAADAADENYALRCLRLVQPTPLGSDAWVHLPVSGVAQQAADEVLGRLGISAADYVVGLHPSFSGVRKAFWRGARQRRQKTWPVAAFGALAHLLHEHAAAHDLRLRVLMDLLPDERAIGEAVVAAAGGRIILSTPPPDFERYKAVLQRMSLLVTPDTGPMHIAGAVGTPMVALFAGADPADCGVYAAPERVTFLRAEDTPQAHLGLRALTPEMVFAACKKFLPTAPAVAPALHVR